MTVSTQAARQRFRALAPVDLDPKDLIPAEVRPDLINCLLRAADVADEIFWRQASPQATVTDLLALTGDDEELKQMVLFHAGPYDRLNDNEPFLPVGSKPPGAALYPSDLSREEFIAHVRKHAAKPSFESPYTVIRRRNGSGLEAVPYHDAYRKQVARLSQLLAAASQHEIHPGFREFLMQRSLDVQTDDYYASDSLWVELSDNPVDLVIGPIEVYEDQLMGLKAAYEAMLLARDFAASRKVEHFEHELPSLCRTLQAQIGKSLAIEQGRVALSVADLIYTGGDARKAIPTIAFSLPNDEQVIEDLGSRQVILRNVLEAKFRLVDWRLRQRLLAAPLDDEDLAFRYFFDHTLFHELSHAIGPHRINLKGETTTVNRSLKHHYAVLEEAKADTLASCLVLETGGSAGRAFLETYVAGLLRPIRFGLADPHGGASTIQFNFLVDNGAAAVDPKTGRLSIHLELVRQSLLRLVSTIIGVQEKGDFEAADRLVRTFCKMSIPIQGLVDRAQDLPVDIRIRFKAGEGQSASEQQPADRALALSSKPFTP